MNTVLARKLFYGGTIGCAIALLSFVPYFEIIPESISGGILILFLEVPLEGIAKIAGFSTYANSVETLADTKLVEGITVICTAIALAVLFHSHRRWARVLGSVLLGLILIWVIVQVLFTFFFS